MADALRRLKTILGEVTDIHRAGAVLDWDQETYMPPGGVHNRAEQLSTLSEVAHRRFTTDEVGKLLDEAAATTAKRATSPARGGPRTRNVKRRFHTKLFVAASTTAAVL